MEKRPVKTYGTIQLQGKHFVIDAMPHVRARFKRMFLHSQEARKLLRIPDTASNCQDLEMMLTRWPHEDPENVLPYILEKAEKARDYILELDQVVSGHGIGSIDTLLPLREYQLKAVELWKRKRRLLCGDALGLGKEQPVSEPTPTPNGWRKFGDLKKGDLVFDENGEPTPILAVYPQGNKGVFQIDFSDGSSTRCGEDHLWKIYTRTKLKRPTIRRLSEIMTHPLKSPSGQWRFWIPRQGAVNYPDSFLPLEPYYVGAVLGNGCVSPNAKGLQITICNEDLDIIKHLPPYFSSRPAPGCQQIYYKHEILKKFHREEIKGLSGNKTIPQRYMVSGKPQRMALLQGLMDTDGSCSKNRTVFHSTSKTLARDVKLLVESLGGLASAKLYAKGWQVRIQIPENPFRSLRKRKEWRKPTRIYKRSIVAITQVANEKSVCISVTGGLYLTNDYIVTHNTAIGIGGFAAGLSPAIVVCQNHLTRQWKAQFLKFVGPKVRVHMQLTGKETKIPEHDVLILPYTMLDSWADRVSGYKAVIFDEVQELRREGTHKYNGAKIIADKADYVLGLSATPIINFGNEIFNILDLIDTDCLGSRNEFLGEWTQPLRNGHHLVRDPIVLGSFIKEQHLFLRRTRKDVGKELPDILKVTVDVPFNKAHLEILKNQTLQLAQSILSSESSFHEKGVAARKLDLLLRQQTGIMKAPAAAEAIADLVESGERVLITAWHREVYSVLQQCFRDRKIPSYLYTGTESPKQKDEAVTAFLDDSNPPGVLLMSIRSGAGLDGLQEKCSYIAHVELDWSGKIHEQATGRLGRDGQPHQVSEIFFVASGGSDPIIAAILGLKAEQASGIVDPLLANATDTDLDGASASRGTALAKQIMDSLTHA